MPYSTQYNPSLIGIQINIHVSHATKNFQYCTSTLITKPQPQRPMSRENTQSIPSHINQSHSYY